MSIEKAITSGSVLVLHNVNETVDSIFLPLIYRINTNTKDGVCEGKNTIIYQGSYTNSSCYHISYFGTPQYAPKSFLCFQIIEY